MARKWIDGLEPHRVFEIFDDLCMIPHGSKNEKAISDHIRDFAKNLGLDVYQDPYYNLIIRKDATPGYEKAPTVVLQAHLDMVCQKTSGSDHDFLKDPIDVVVDGDDIRARDTTLGADDGTGLAFAMCALESKTLKHPALEVVLTSDEEAGMSGIKHLDFSRIHGRVILNLDCSDEGIVVGCGGSTVYKISVPRTADATVFDKETRLAVTIGGLLGGHSGLMAAAGRANANAVLGRLLSELRENVPFELVSFDGGTATNSITPESTAVITLAAKDAGAVETFAKTMEKNLKKELQGTDGGVTVRVSPAGEGPASFGRKGTETFLSLINLIPNGLLEMSGDIKTLAQLSGNLGIVSSGKDAAEVQLMVRARYACGKQKIRTKVKQLASCLGLQVQIASDSPEWEYNPDSRLSSLIQRIFKREYKKDLVVEISHAGNECGAFFQHFPDADIVCSGTKITGAHSPAETVKISTIQKEWNMMCKTLEGMLEY